MLRNVILLLLCGWSAGVLLAQAPLYRGTVRFYLEGTSSDEGNKAAVYTVYFKPDTATAVLGLVSGEEALTVIYDYPARMTYNVFKEAGQAMVVPIAMEDVSASTDELGYKVIMEDAEPRDILGYPCNYITIEPAEPGGGLRISAWVTDKIQSPFKVPAGMEKYFPGFPLDCTVMQAGGTEKVVYRAYAVEKEAPEVMFVVPQ
jgi:hypothetical protein